MNVTCRDCAIPYEVMPAACPNCGCAEAAPAAREPDGVDAPVVVASAEVVVAEPDGVGAAPQPAAEPATGDESTVDEQPAAAEPEPAKPARRARRPKASTDEE